MQRKRKGAQLEAVEQYGSATLRLSADGPIGLAMMRGPVTAQAIPRLIQAAVDSHHRRRSLASVTFMDRAIVTVTGEQMFEAATKLAASGRQWLPGALVVGPDLLQAAQDYAWMVAQLGHIRGVFTDGLEAMQWVRERLATAQSQATYRRNTFGR